MIVNESIMADANMTATSYSTAMCLEKTSGFSIQAVVTGSPVGTLKLQGSNDESSPTNYTDIGGSSFAASATTFIWNVDRPHYKWVRLAFVFTSGSGTLNARYNQNRGSQ